MFKTISCRALACASLLAVASASTPASAQHIQRIIVFGDSYADTGNALRLAGINPASTQVYTTGRFSGGTNYVDTLSNILQVPQFNFAIGGASTTGNGTAGLPGFPFEVQEFLAGGGTLGFPTVNTTLTRSDLVAISIGGNDSRYYQQGGGTVAGAPAAAAAAVTSFQQNFDLVMQHGTPTISFLAGNAALLPEVATNPSAQAVRAAYSAAYNSGAQQVLAGYASRGAIVHYLDLTQIANNVAANPTAYGITNGLVCPIFPDPTCVVNSNGYLFYGDALHLTSTGFAIVGKYVAVQLDAPLTLQAPADLGLDTARQWGRTLSTRSDLYGRAAGPQGFRVYILGDGFARDYAPTSQTADFEVRGYGVTAGAEYGLPNGLVGVAANYSRPRVRFGNESSRDDSRSWQVGAYGSLYSGGLFGQAYLGYGRDNHHLDRAGVVEDMTASPHGNHVTAGAKGGYLLPLGAGVGVGPIVAVDYARAKVDGYTEKGDLALTLNVGNQSLKSLRGQVGAEVSANVSGVHPYADLTLEHEFSRNGRQISFSQTSAPVIVNEWAVAGGKETYGRLSGGMSATITPHVSVDAAFSRTIGLNGGQEMGAQVGVKANF